MPPPTTDAALSVENLGRSTLGGTRRYALTSRIVGQTFSIDIARPALPVPAGQPLPVVYVLDGDGAFGVAAGAARMMQMEAGGLPPMLIVGVGYRYTSPAAAPAEHGAWRSRDFSPSLDVESRARTQAALAAEGYACEVEHGGAASFLRFITEELMPFVAGRYPVDKADQTLVGMSLGGLFALHVLFEAPASFQRYLILSPALWWDERAIFAREAALAARQDDLPASVFLGVGGAEEAVGPPYLPVSLLAQLHAALGSRRYPSLRLAHHVFPDETHMSVYPGGLCRGLRTLFT
jgi:predicted alpha/beta superfamily hydrolase